MWDLTDLGRGASLLGLTFFLFFAYLGLKSMFGNRKPNNTTPTTTPPAKTPEV